MAPSPVGSTPAAPNSGKAVEKKKIRKLSSKSDNTVREGGGGGPGVNKSSLW